MSYENDEHSTNYITIEDYDVLTCIKKTIKIHN